MSPGATAHAAATTSSATSSPRLSIWIADSAAVSPAEPREHKGGADIRMAGEGKLGAGRENSDFGGVRGIARRQYERRLGQIELGRNGLHLLRRESLSIGDDGQRIASE